MGTALESYVIDNDMLGGILSAHSLIEVSDETLDPTPFIWQQQGWATFWVSLQRWPG